MIKSEIQVELIDHMGSDLSIVNAARVSFAKQKAEFEASDEKLLRYLAEHEHTSPFRHTSISIRCKAPIFLARQLAKHQVGMSWNEVSRRYVNSEPEFWFPKEWHVAPTNMKQGCGETLDAEDARIIQDFAEGATQASLEGYLVLTSLHWNVAPEEARILLPLNTMTEWVWTGSLQAFFHVYRLRSDVHAQTVAREFAGKLANVIQDVFPVAWKVLLESSRDI